MRPHQFEFSEELQDFVAQKVASGDYDSPQEYIQFLVKTDLKRQQMIDKLNETLERSIAEADAGNVKSSEEVRAELKNWDARARERLKQ